MTSEPLLTIDEEPISAAQVFRYLQTGRKLDGFIGEIVRQFVIERELIAREQELAIAPAVVEQAIIDFRLQQKLTDAQQFQQWLANSSNTFEAFYAQVANGFKLQKLREVVTEAKLPEYFIERKVFLDRVIMSRIIVADQELAEELKSQIQDGAQFEQLAKEYSITDDRIMNGMLGAISRGAMPDALRAAVDLAQPGEVIGPLGLDDRWGLFRIEEFVAASVDDRQIRQSLQDELFEQWLGEKMQTLPIRLQLGES